MQTLFKEITPKRYANGNEMKENSSNVLDQYFTKPSVALKCFQKACEVIKKYENLDDFIFLEPSAGDGVFYDLFPKNRRIGIDIEPKRDGFIQCDFLNYKLPTHQKVICLGNPPFGHRGVMALEFINHARNCDFVCFILPMFFESQGKGSIKYRVKGLNLLYSERLEKNAFIDFKNKEMDLEQTFLKIIEKKHEELNLGQDYNAIFSKIRDFEANAIGQIGEEFLKSALNAIDGVINDGIIHDEYDIMTKSGVSFEVKTVQKGRTNNTFLVQWYKPTIQL
ncbi:hypothetical protein HpEKA26_13020 [Helicobacter pylori]